MLLDTVSSPWDPNLSPEPCPEDSWTSWKACTLGYVDQISDENERRTRESIARLCEDISEEAASVLEKIRLDGEPGTWSEEVEGWTKFSLGCIESLWRERMDVAIAVKRNIDEGVVL